MKNDTVCKEKASNVFLKEREQYFEIEDLKAQLQDKNIAIIELKKLIEKCRGKFVETKKPSVVRQPNAQRIPKPSVLGKPTPFSDSLERKIFSKTKSVPKTNVSEGLSKPVTTQIWPQTGRQAGLLAKVVECLEREVVKACVLCKKTCIGVHLLIQRREYGYECNTSMNLHELQEGSKEWDDQREVVKELLEEEMLSMEDEEVSLVDGVFEGVFGALALEMEALVDAMEVYGV
ncbi:hypothetical protein Tco_1054931 [Tanacetum coccineum]|uniref:DUF4378 domain-containing protein n=1 Tax=Tanacetum coccineum TaxID=301880 RepID=A0ABQ5GYK7_9ASTR